MRKIIFVRRLGDAPVRSGVWRRDRPRLQGEVRSSARAQDLIVGHYEREGEIRIGDTAVDSPSDREVARRERMKRVGIRGRRWPAPALVKGPARINRD